MDRGQVGWLMLAALSGLWAAVGLVDGGSLSMISGLLCAIAAACAVDAGSRQRVMAAAARAFSSSTLRTVVIIFAAASLIQFLPLELALFAAGDILAYVELMAAVGLIAANTRFAAARKAASVRLKQTADAIRRTIRRTPRAQRPTRPVRPRPPVAEDPEPRAWALA